MNEVMVELHRVITTRAIPTWHTMAVSQDLLNLRWTVTRYQDEYQHQALAESILEYIFYGDAKVSADSNFRLSTTLYESRCALDLANGPVL